MEPLFPRIPIETGDAEVPIALNGLGTIIDILVLIALATTVGSLALQGSFGRSSVFALVASIIAVVSAASFAFRGVRRV